ncbi:ribosome biogenesis GTP-binding protein YihA/YsxC [Acidaminobacter hydrogenoformans]|uniref:Probable GTP-binding protein EngB n=1 Tax=Acidaminobacter hydrogenoformans DSM 2784 TaxID=1120920 RepID=A0A1G5RXQ2_9FIRM|nr:ribosome biogenesis GTP-binding protein YihA/YsxC [Acidaminobacter hydrogenoformans]SCZ78915.1 GTP-binding protein [Acidaminobacter hydrogenoformans DSM 2784]
MKIQNSRFIISAVKRDQYPEDLLPEIAMAGRSNVGKSSLINMLINRKGLAKTSSTPGKTQTINFYDLDGKMRLVDLPGYGYARVSKDKKSGWGKIIESYLVDRPNLMEVFLLVDLRHDPSEDDRLMYEWIRTFGYKGIVIATKADKIKNSQLQIRKKALREKLGMDPEDVLLITSADSRKGKYDVWDFINSLLEQKGFEARFERQQPDQAER